MSVDILKIVKETLSDKPGRRTRNAEGKTFYFVRYDDKSSITEYKRTLKGKYHMRTWKKKNSSNYGLWVCELETKTKPTPTAAPTTEPTAAQTALNGEAKKLRLFLSSHNFIIDLEPLKAIISGIKAKHNITLVGKTATGKSTLIKLLCKYYNKGYEEITCNPYQEAEEIKGKYIAKSNATKDGLNIEWIKSQVHKAIEGGEWLIFEEINFLNPVLYSSVYSLLDHNKKLILTEKEGEEVSNGGETVVFFTLNAGYGGTFDLNDNPAFKRRVQQTIVRLDYLTPQAEAKYIHDTKGLNKDIALVLCKFMDQLRKEKEGDASEYPDLGISITEAIADHINNGMTINEALEPTLINFCTLDNEAQEALREKASLFIKGC